MVDKQVYRDLKTVSDADLEKIKKNFAWVTNQLEVFVPESEHLVVVVLGSSSDAAFGQKIQKHCTELGISSVIRVTSAHKSTEDTLKLVRYYESLSLKVVFIAVAGRSNGLGPVISGNSCFPVINCPPLKSDDIERDIWSSLNMPSGLGCSTVINPESAALHAAQIIAHTNYVILGKLKVRQLNNYIRIKQSDKDLLAELGEKANKLDA